MLKNYNKTKYKNIQDGDIHQLKKELATRAYYRDKINIAQVRLRDAEFTSEPQTVYLRDCKTQHLRI